MPARDVESGSGLRLSDAITQLRDELLRARAAGAESEIQLPVESMTVELTLTFSRTGGGKAGLAVPVVGLELGGDISREHGTEQRVTIQFGGPVDRQGRPVKVAEVADELPD